MTGGDPDEPDGWAFDAPWLEPAGELLTLALLEDLSALLSLHGYPPLRGVARGYVIPPTPDSITRRPLASVRLICTYVE